MTTETVNGHVPIDAEPAAEMVRYQLLPGGARLVRLHQGEEGWLTEYQRILRVAGQDFLRRARLPGHAERMLGDLAELLASDKGVVWLLVDVHFRLLGFTAIRLGREVFSDELIAEIPVFYLYPKKTRGYFPWIKVAMLTWARERGVMRLYFLSRRPHERAWVRHGAHKVGTIYDVDLRGA